MPCGLNTKNISAIKYANHNSIPCPPNKSAKYISPSFSPTPITNPPTIAPGIDVSPPIYITGKAFITASIKVYETLTLSAHSNPATSAIMPVTAQTTAQK